jgi:hypothetical protein
LRDTYATRLIAEAMDYGQDGDAILYYVSKQLGYSTHKNHRGLLWTSGPDAALVIVNRLDNGPPRRRNPEQPDDYGPILENTT